MTRWDYEFYDKYKVLTYGTVDCSLRHHDSANRAQVFVHFSAQGLME